MVRVSGGSMPIPGRGNVYLTTTEAAALWRSVTGSMSDGIIRRMFDRGELAEFGVETTVSQPDGKRFIDKDSLIDHLVRTTRLQYQRAQMEQEMRRAERDASSHMEGTDDEG